MERQTNKDAINIIRSLMSNAALKHIGANYTSAKNLYDQYVQFYNNAATKQAAYEEIKIQCERPMR